MQAAFRRPSGVEATMVAEPSSRPQMMPFLTVATATLSLFQTMELASFSFLTALRPNVSEPSVPRRVRWRVSSLPVWTTA